jgi:hypothetical protein
MSILSSQNSVESNRIDMMKEDACSFENGSLQCEEMAEIDAATAVLDRFGHLKVSPIDIRPSQNSVECQNPHCGIATMAVHRTNKRVSSWCPCVSVSVCECVRV